VTPIGRRAALVIRDEAEPDIAAAVDWYEGQSVGLGIELVRAVEVCVQSIRRWPEARRIVFGDLEPPVRRALVRRFPYSIYYVAVPGAVHVLGCLHQHRDPAATRKQIEGRVRDV